MLIYIAVESLFLKSSRKSILGQGSKSIGVVIWILISGIMESWKIGCLVRTGRLVSKHLENHGVGPGDIFLFFGWFRQTESIEGKLRFVKTEKEKHILWGYFQVYAVFDSYSKLTPQFHYHPHATV
jgi:hypothetical protein